MTTKSVYSGGVFQLLVSLSDCSSLAQVKVLIDLATEHNPVQLSMSYGSETVFYTMLTL